MAGLFRFELVSPERILLSEDAEQVVVPGAEGEFTVLVGHAPVISTLRPGVLDITLPGGHRRVFVKGGFAEVEPDRLTVLAPAALDLDELDSAQLSEQIGIAEAEVAEAADEQARARAEVVLERLRSLEGPRPH